jgi:hypothetical protein
MKLTLIKSLLLLVATAISIYVLAIKFSYTPKLFYIITCCSFLYLIFHTSDIVLRNKKRTNNIKSYLYFTLGYFTKRIILIGAFCIITFVFFKSGNKVFLFGVLVSTLLIAEIISIYLNFYFKELFIELRENNFYVSENKLIIYAKHILDIEFRHDIYYITLKNNKTHLIDTKRFYKKEEDLFNENFKNWILTNEIATGEALKTKLMS